MATHSLDRVKRLLKHSDAVVGMVSDLRRATRTVARSAPFAHDRRVVRAYLADHEVRKLQLGAGPTHLDGWLSSDIAPRDRDTVFLDATQPFPFPDGTFDYVYSEHMIEHISWPQGLSMLTECRRVLRPGGKLRIATPDLAVLLELYSDPHHARHEAYIRWITDKFLDGAPGYSPVFVINNAFQNWGHQFLYDEPQLSASLAEAGFGDFVRCLPGQSLDEHLRGIERHGFNAGNCDMADFETMVVEAARGS